MALDKLKMLSHKVTRQGVEAQTEQSTQHEVREGLEPEKVHHTDIYHELRVKIHTGRVYTHHDYPALRLVSVHRTWFHQHGAQTVKERLQY